jgi:hypothetical protein
MAKAKMTKEEREELRLERKDRVYKLVGKLNDVLLLSGIDYDERVDALLIVLTKRYDDTGDRCNLLIDRNGVMQKRVIRALKETLAEMLPDREARIKRR